jgi:hypothetical protein
MLGGDWCRHCFIADAHGAGGPMLGGYLATEWHMSSTTTAKVYIGSLLHA